MSDSKFDAITARHAFDVMMRRGWSALKSPVPCEGWRVDMNNGNYFAFGREDEIGAQPAHWPNPFTALVEADKWWRDDTEAKPCPTPTA